MSTTDVRAAERRTLGSRINTEGLTTTHYTAMVLAGITGVVHVYLYWAQGFLPFLLAGLGFLGAVGLLLLTVNRRSLVYLAGIPYTLVQMAGWLLAGTPEFTLGVADKVVQVALIVLLVVLYRRDRAARRAAVETEPTPAN